MIRLVSRSIILGGLIAIFAAHCVSAPNSCVQAKDLKISTVHGRVVAYRKGSAEESIPNAEIELRQEVNDEWRTIAKVKADSDGAFDIPNIRPGRYDIYARTSGLQTWAKIVVVKASAKGAHAKSLVLIVEPAMFGYCGTARVEKRKPG